MPMVCNCCDYISAANLPAGTPRLFFFSAHRVRLPAFSKQCAARVKDPRLPHYSHIIVRMRANMYCNLGGHRT